MHWGRRGQHRGSSVVIDYQQGRGKRRVSHIRSKGFLTIVLPNFFNCRPSPLFYDHSHIPPGFLRLKLTQDQPLLRERFLGRRKHLILIELDPVKVHPADCGSRVLAKCTRWTLLQTRTPELALAGWATDLANMKFVINTLVGMSGTAERPFSK
ncbi:hypothetical protein P691DRAFT_785878 [Macrolepiota fuliginosa MF-IS2]|uniref:Uncharacterized protein n=1 Tax=Macrolepiota fuliginosa MF-IS2 TaxID=1400762 RepID=A0A9P5X5M0_9AGAR|nr:hypothetical protein P691DRAFT_785878 [Macrolepiota fuliginosa MF-IS2]